MVILGIDPGSRYTGWGVIRVEGNRMVCIDAGRLSLGNSEHAQRLVLIYDGLSDILNKYQPKAAAIEGVFVHKNAQSALKLGQARGVAMLACAHHHLLPEEISPRSVKQCITGSGGATKDMVAMMVKRLLHLQKPLSVDATDALAIAISCGHMLSSKRKIEEKV